MWFSIFRFWSCRDCCGDCCMKGPTSFSHDVASCTHEIVFQLYDSNVILSHMLYWKGISFTLSLIDTPVVIDIKMSIGNSLCMQRDQGRPLCYDISAKRIDNWKFVLYYRLISIFALEEAGGAKKQSSSSNEYGCTMITQEVHLVKLSRFSGRFIYEFNNG